MERLSIKEILRKNIFYKEKLLDISQYEMKNIEIFEKIFKNEDRINLLITPDKEVIEILSLIVLAIKLYIKNLNNKDNNILDSLNIGDIVVYKGKKAEYLGIDKLYGDKKIKLKYKGNSTEWINIENYYRLSVYSGDSKILNTMSNNKSTKKNGKYILADMLDIDLENLSSSVKEQMIIVYPSKNELENLLNNTKIKIGNKKYSFSEIFPCKYYSSIDNYTNLKGNKLNLKEVLIFTSNLNVAEDIVQENEEVCNLLLLGEDTYVNEIGGQLDFLLSRIKLKKIYILNTFNKITQLEQLLQIGFDIELNAWTKTVLNKEIGTINMKQVCFDNKRISLFLNRTVESLIVDKFLDVQKRLFDLKGKLLQILKNDLYCENQENFLRISYGLLKIFEKIVIPIKQYDEFILNNDLNKYPVYKLIEELMIILKQNKFYEDSYKAIESIVKLIKELNELLYYKNPKFQYLKSMDLGYTDAILCSNSIEKSILQKYQFIKDKYIIVGCIKNYKFYSNFKKIVFTGIYDTKNIDQIYCFNGLNIINLLYASEVAKYNIKVSKFNKLVKLIEENNKLESSDNIERLQKIKVNYNEFIDDKSIDDVEETEIEIEKNIYDNISKFNYLGDFENYLDIEDLLNISIQENASSICLEHDNGYVKKKINFKDSKFALLTPFYKSKCLDDENNSIVIKGIDLLQKGDRLIFIYDRTEDEITELFCKIMCSDKFKNKYNKHYYNMKYWKNVLKKYIDNYFEEYSLVVTELKLHGINRTEQAIKSWVLYKNIIGPTEKEVYKALADITNDKYFLENWEEIYESCTLIRSLKIKLKNNFNYMVIKSVVNEKSEGIFENLVYDVLGNLKQYAQIEEIAEILDVSTNVPINKTNCILEEKALCEFLK